MSNREGVFTQISLFSVLLNGRYGGVCSVADVKKYGNLTIATMDRLDGEMQMIDGVVYQACADGRLLLPKDASLARYYHRFQTARVWGC